MPPEEKGPIHPVVIVKEGSAAHDVFKRWSGKMLPGAIIPVSYAEFISFRDDVQFLKPVCPHCGR